VLADDHGWPLAAAVTVGVMVATGLGGLFSWVAVRRNLEAIFVGIITLAFSLVFTNLAQGLRTVTGGETGRVVTSGGDVLRGPVTSYYLFLGVVVGFLLPTAGWSGRTSGGPGARSRMIRSQRNWRVSTWRTIAILAGAVGAAMVGLTGALFAHHEAFISPTSYAFVHVDVRALVIVAFGGIGSLLGPVVGAVALGVVDEVLRPLGQLRLAVYGGVLIVLFLGFPRGLVPAMGALVGGGRRTTGRSRRP
jgi:branched-chain amino acid transport system permease protein